MNENDILPLNIVLIGFMGSGKTTVGRELHHRLGYPLVDMDQMIEQRVGKSITTIFAEQGEAAFREMETAVLLELALSDRQQRIISTGGGVVGSEENREILKRMGYVVWLDAPVQVIAERTAKSRTRPLLLDENPEEKIRDLMAKRQPLYQETAHLKLDTAGLDSKELATGILECASYFFSQPER
jgi:shikimate kinase